MNEEVSIKVVDMEYPQYVKLRIKASNKLFAGCVDIYQPTQIIDDLIATVKKFPSSPQDLREIRLGFTEPQTAGAGVNFNLRTIDTLGHCILEATLHSEKTFNNTIESSKIEILFTPAILDNFVFELESLNLEKLSHHNLRAKSDAIMYFPA